MAEGGKVSVDDGKSTEAAEERQVRSGDLKVNLADDIQADVPAVLPSDGTSQFDDATLKAMTEVYLKEGDNEYSKGETNNAVHFYSEGLQVNCKDVKLNAKLYSNRAAAQLLLGNFQEALDDATLSAQLAPTFIEAIEIGASACVQQHMYQEAITWCQKGLAINNNNKKLLDLWTECYKQLTGIDETRINQEINTNRDNTKAKIEDIQINDQLPQAAVQKILHYANILHFSIEVGDKAGEGGSSCSLGNAYYSLGDFKRAIQYYERHLKIAKELGAKAEEGKSYCNLGNAYHSLGDFERAIQYHERHLKIAKEVGDKAGEGKSYSNLGIAYRTQGNFEKAIQHHERHLTISKEVGDKAGEGSSYGNLGSAYHSQGDFKRAIEYHKCHLTIAKEVGDKAGEGRSYGNLGNAYDRLGDLETAIRYHERSLKISKELGDKAGEGKSYCNLGNAYRSLGDFERAIQYHERDLKIAKEVGDKAGEGSSYGNLGNAYDCLGDFERAIQYHERHLKIVKEVGDKAGEGKGYCNLGNAYHSLGDFKRATQYHKHHLKIAQEVGDKAGEGSSYCNLGNAYHRLEDFEKAIQHHERHLEIAKEVGDKAGEGKGYCNLGNAYHSQGDFKRAIQYHKHHLKIAQEVGDKAGEGRSYCNLGNAYHRLEDFKTAIQYHERSLKIAKEVGDKAEEGRIYYNLGNAYWGLGDLERAVSLSRCCVLIFDAIRANLRFRDDWKISYRDMQRNAYTCLWRLHLKQNQILDALLSAEQGRAQALNDLICFRYGSGGIQPRPHTPGNFDLELLASCAVSNTVFMAVEDKERKIFYWFINSFQDIQLRSTEISNYGSFKDVNTLIGSLMNTASRSFKRGVIKCEDRSLDEPCTEELVKKRSGHAYFSPECSPKAALRMLYDVIVEPIGDLINGNEIIFVPESSLWSVPFAALMDHESNYLCDSFRVRTIPSLTTLKLINDYPDDFQYKKSALLVGDPCLEGVLFEGRKLDPLPCAREEVEIIGRIIGADPLIGEEAKKDEVLRRLPSFALVHFAAHGRMETGEIALAPRSTCSSQPFVKAEDCILTMKDVLDIRIRARLVVLSCCHSGRGEIKAEGVVGIARAFLGAGARSVLVSLWAIDDEATLVFMKHFYEELVTGKLASEALNQAMKSMKDSEEFSDVKYWAPFVLIGDDVTLE